MGAKALGPWHMLFCGNTCTCEGLFFWNSFFQGGSVEGAHPEEDLETMRPL